MKTKFVLAAHDRSPDVTVILVSYDRDGLLKQTVSSVLSQTYTRLRLVVRNTNPARCITAASLISHLDPRLTVRNCSGSGNVTLARALREECNQATTPYCLYIGDDDLLHPQFLEFAFLALSVETESPVGFFSHYVTAQVPPKNWQAISRMPQTTFLTTNAALMYLVERKFPFIGCYGVVSTELARKITFNQEMTIYGDNLMALEICSEGTVAVDCNPLLMFRSHEGSYSQTRTSSEELWASEAVFLRQIGAFQPKLQSKQDWMRFQWGIHRFFLMNHLEVRSRQEFDKRRLFTNFYVALVRRTVHDLGLRTGIKIGLLAIYLNVRRFFTQNDPVLPNP